MKNLFPLDVPRGPGIKPTGTRSGTWDSDSSTGNTGCNTRGSRAPCSCVWMLMPLTLGIITLGRSSDIFSCRQEPSQSGRQWQQQKQLLRCFWQEAQLLFLALAAARVFITGIQDKRGIEFRYVMAVKRLSAQHTWGKPSGNSKLFW